MSNPNAFWPPVGRRRRDLIMPTSEVVVRHRDGSAGFAGAFAMGVMAAVMAWLVVAELMPEQPTYLVAPACECRCLGGIEL